MPTPWQPPSGLRTEAGCKSILSSRVSRILRKLRLSSRTQAALWPVREGLVEVEREPH